jgi:hypothetical protein
MAHVTAGDPLYILICHIPVYLGNACLMGILISNLLATFDALTHVRKVDPAQSIANRSQSFFSPFWRLAGKIIAAASRESAKFIEN